MEQTSSDQPKSRRTKAQMLELLSEFDKNHGMTVKAFCDFHQISEGSFYTARKRHRPLMAPQQESAGFIAIGRPAALEAASGLFAEVNGIRLYQPVPADYLKSLAV